MKIPSRMRSTASRSPQQDVSVPSRFLGVARPIVRKATLRDLDLLVRHRRQMWDAIASFSTADLDRADVVYRRWARSRMQSGRLVGLIVEVHSTPVASGCVWLMKVQPRPGGQGTTAAYLLSMFTEPSHRGRGHAARVVRAAIQWAEAHRVSTMLLHASRFGEPLYRRMGFERTKEMRIPVGRRPRPVRRSKTRPPAR